MRLGIMYVTSCNKCSEAIEVPFLIYSYMYDNSMWEYYEGIVCPHCKGLSGLYLRNIESELSNSRW
jgi:hypothetical protein